MRFRIYAIGSGGEESNYRQSILEQGITAPDKMSPLNVDGIKAGDGRHRSFTWTVPRDNGEAITKYVLRRSHASQPKHDYVFTCTTTSPSSQWPNPNQNAGTVAQACSSASTECWNQRFYCTGDYSEDYTATWTGKSVSVILGSDTNPAGSGYLTPTETYSWKVLAVSSQNDECFDDDPDTCDKSEYGVGWSDPVSITQPEATPDKATNLGIGDVTQTTARLTWVAPVDNGSPLDTTNGYRIQCTDAQTAYVDPFQVAQASGGWIKPMVEVIFGAGVLERVVTGLEPGTTYACVLASENGKGGYSSPVSPITTSGAPYRTDEAIFFAHYDLLNTLPTYPDPVDASTMSCVAIVDPVTHPGSTEVGTDGAPTEAAPALWYQLSWDGARPNAAARNRLGAEQYHVQMIAPSLDPSREVNVSGALDTFELGYRLVVDPDGMTGGCRVNRYNNVENTPSFSDVDELKTNQNWHEMTCANKCDADARCKGIRPSKCNSNRASDGITNSVACNGNNRRCHTYSNYPCSDASGPCTWPGYTLTANSQRSSTGDYRCYARRETHARQTVLLPGTYAYATSYTFQVKPWNAGEYGYPPTAWTSHTCTAVPFRPAAPTTVSATFAIDRRVKIQWSAPDQHGGGAIEQYLHQICKVSSNLDTTCDKGSIAATKCSATDISGQSSYARYMCTDGSGAQTSSNSLCTAGQMAPHATPFLLEALSTSDPYTADTHPGPASDSSSSYSTGASHAHARPAGGGPFAFATPVTPPLALALVQACFPARTTWWSYAAATQKVSAGPRSRYGSVRRRRRRSLIRPRRRRRRSRSRGPSTRPRRCSTASRRLRTP